MMTRSRKETSLNNIYLKKYSKIAYLAQKDQKLIFNVVSVEQIAILYCPSIFKIVLNETSQVLKGIIKINIYLTKEKH